MKTILLYSPSLTPRLRYIADFLFGRVIGASFNLTDSKVEFESSSSFKMNYSHEIIQNAHLNIIPKGLLFETSISQQTIELVEWNSLKAFFKTSEEEIPFDIFSASFFLMTRYEEYLPYTPDLYQRYPEKNSTAFKHGFLQLPLIDLWAIELKRIIQRIDSSFKFEERRMKFIPTYDIDIAYSYIGKGLKRNLGGAIRDLLLGKIASIKERLNVLNRKEKDPFDSFSWLDHLHTKYQLQPIYFFLVSKGGKLDKNISPEHPLMQDLISKIHNQYSIGIHPSYQSHDELKILKHEISIINSTKSRQHYIRFQLPSTYRNLISLGITEDYSMGYGSINGFRASTSFDHNWFDLEKNEVTSLRIFPFCFMECNSFFEQKVSVEEAYNEMIHYKNVVDSVGGNLILIWHNFSLGTDSTWKGWKEIYHQFLEKLHS